MLRRADIDHILRAAAALTGHARFVMVGSGAVIATAKHIPVAMMLTKEIDIYADDVADPDPISDLIDASIGRDSQFDKTFGYYGDGVSPRTAIMPLDWRTRAREVQNTGRTGHRGLSQRRGHCHREVMCVAREGSGLAARGSAFRHRQGGSDCSPVANRIAGGST